MLATWRVQPSSPTCLLPSEVRSHYRAMPSLILLAALAVVTAAYIYARNPRKLPTPPGPRGLPIIGNALQLPREHPWLAFSEWSQTYGQCLLAMVACTSNGKGRRLCHVSSGFRYSDRRAELSRGDIRPS